MPFDRERPFQEEPADSVVALRHEFRELMGCEVDQRTIQCEIERNGGGEPEALWRIVAQLRFAVMPDLAASFFSG